MATDALWVCPRCQAEGPLLSPCPRCEPDEPAPEQGSLAEASLALERGAASLALRLARAAPEGADEPGALAVERAALEALGRWGEAALIIARQRAASPNEPGLARDEAEARLRDGDAEGALAALGDAHSPPELRARALLASTSTGPAEAASRIASLLEAEPSPSAELSTLAARAFARAASQPGADASLWKRSAELFGRAWAEGPRTLDLSLAYAEALSREPGPSAVELLEATAEEGEGSPSWHRAFVAALLASPSADDAARARQAAERALSRFPADEQLARLARDASRSAWERRRRDLLSGAQVPPSGSTDEEPEAPAEGAPDYLVDLRARIRKGTLGAVRAVPDRQREIIEVLCRYERPNAIVTGPPGCGKSALLRAVAHQIHAREGIPPMLKGYGLYELDPIGIVGGTDNVGVLEARLTALARFCESNKLILFIDNFHLVLGAGSYSGRPAGLSELLQPLMSGGNVKIVAATSDESFDALTKSVGLERRMTRIRVPAMSPDEATELMVWLKPKLEQHYEQLLPEAILPLTARLADHHVKSRALPDSAIDLLERSCAKALVDGDHEVSPGHVLRALAQMLRVPLEQVELDRMSRLLGLEELLARRVVGQHDAIRAVSDVIRMTKAELDLHPDRPDGVFLFVGPSGVGKTELARGLSAILNADETGFVRLDMSELSEPHNVSRLFGTTPGYVGFEQEGQLTGALRLNPGAVILLDEIEKAHPKVYDVFLQVFDAGRMTDGRGKVVDCSHATFIMTSNLGTAELGEARLGFLREEQSRRDRERTVRTALEKHFRPEFLNRLDAIVVFDALSEQILHDIVAQKLALLRARFAGRGLEVALDEALVPLIAGRTDRLRSGARGVIRAIEQLVAVPLTREVLARRPHRCFRVSVEAERVSIEATPEPPPTSGRGLGEPPPASDRKRRGPMTGGLALRRRAPATGALLAAPGSNASPFSTSPRVPKI